MNDSAPIPPEELREPVRATYDPSARRQATRLQRLQHAYDACEGISDADLANHRFVYDRNRSGGMGKVYVLKPTTGPAIKDEHFAANREEGK